MASIFSLSGNPDNFSWNKEWGKTDGGLGINPYEVYVIWDPDLTPETYNVGGVEKRIY